MSECNHACPECCEQIDMNYEDTKYPEIRVKLVGEDGNAFLILAKVTNAINRAVSRNPNMRAANDASKHFFDKTLADMYEEEAKSGDYDNLLRVTMKWVTVY